MKKPEMVMISYEIPLSEALDTVTRNATDYGNGYIKGCREAVAARKTLYERWRDNVSPWKDEHRRRSEGVCINHARLIASAPQLLEALIWAWSGHHQKEPGYPLHSIERAIRAALPTEVADEVLGAEND